VGSGKLVVQTITTTCNIRHQKNTAILSQYHKKSPINNDGALNLVWYPKKIIPN